MSNESSDLINKKNKEKCSFIIAGSAFEEFKIMLLMFLSIGFGNVCEYIPQYIAFGFVGHLPNSTILLASVGLSRMFVNCVGVSITWGMTKGLDTLLPHIVGNDDKNNTLKISIYLQQATIITHIILIPLLISQYYAGDIMYFIGQPPHLIDNINKYSRALIFYVIAALWFSLLLRLIRPLNYNNQILLITIISAIISYPLNYLFLIYFKYDYIATATVMNICMIQNVLSSTILLIYKGYYFIFIPQSIDNIFNIKSIKHYILLSIPTLIIYSGAWWIQESITILSGYVYIPQISISATVIGVTLIDFCSGFTEASTVTLSIRIGQYIGMGSIKLAKRAMYVGIIVITLNLSIILIILLYCRKQLPLIWISNNNNNNNKEVISLSSDIIDMAALNIIMYTLYDGLTNIYIALGYQTYTAIMLIVFSVIIGLPLCVLLLFYFNLRSSTNFIGLYVVWLCSSIGYALSAAVLFVLLLCGYINWNDALKQSQNRLKETFKYGATQ